MPRRAAFGFGRLLFAALLACATSPAYADDPQPSATCDAQVETPPADQALCTERAPPSPESPWLLLPRALLAIPRLAIRTVTQVLTLGTGIEDDLHVSGTVYALTYSEKKHFDAYPTVLYDTGAGAPIVGVRVARANAFGEGELFAARALYGGRYNQLVDFDADAGRRFGGTRPRAKLVLEADSRGRFFGIGNGDLANPALLDLPLDAQVEGPAVRTEFRTESIRLEYAVERWMTPTVMGRLSQLWRARDVTTADDDDVSVNQIFAPSTLVGFGPTLVDAYTEIAIHWDTREALRTDTPRTLPGAGFRGLLWAGTQAEFAAPHSIFGRMGIDLHSFIDLYRGNRILHLRLRAMGVLGSLSDIPFFDLAKLGGPRLLRGYETGRFHGRTNLLGSVEYRWPVQERIAAYLFVDMGRAWVDVKDMSPRSLLDSRVGFGFGLQAFSFDKALFRVQLAGSIDGGFFFHFALNTTDEPSINY